MTESAGPAAATRPRPPAGRPAAPQPANLADILERVLDKGIIIAGDIRVNLLDIELLTIKIRLLIVSVDKAEEMGIDWWRNDPMLTARRAGPGRGEPASCARGSRSSSRGRGGGSRRARRRPG